jgi:hypothetical protein
MAGSTQEIQAKLGVDTSSVPKDLNNAKSYFEKFGKDVEASGKKTGEATGGSIVEAIGKKFDTKELGKGLAVALGINIEKIAENIASAITGGTKEGWEDAQKIIDENAKLIEEKLTAAMSDERLTDHLESNLKKAIQAAADFKPKKSFAQSLGIGANQLNAEQLKEQAELEHAILVAEKALGEQKKKNAEADKDFQKDYHDAAISAIDDEAKIVEATVRKHEIEKKLQETGLSIKETRALQLELLKQENILKETGQKIDEETYKRNQEEADQIAKEADKAEKRAKKLGDLKLSQAEQERRVRDDATELADRSKLTIGELSQITNAKPTEKSGLDLSFGKDADLTQEQTELKRKAQEAKDAEDRFEELRKAGRVGEASEALKRLDEMKANLVNTGFVKSTEDPATKLVEQLHLDTEKLNKTLGEIRDISKGKFVNE